MKKIMSYLWHWYLEAFERTKYSSDVKGPYCLDLSKYHTHNLTVTGDFILSWKGEYKDLVRVTVSTARPVTMTFAKGRFAFLNGIAPVLTNISSNGKGEAVDFMLFQMDKDNRLKLREVAYDLQRS